jgi:hypothetical protein
MPLAPQVDAYMDALEHPFKAEVQALREIIVQAHPKIAERIKWNSPSYYYGVDMAAFNLRAKGFVQLIFVFHKGQMIHDHQGLLQGVWKDRREARFSSMEDILAKKSTLEQVIRDWVALVEE